LSYVKEMENAFRDSFKLLNGLPDYIAIEEKDEIEYDNDKFKNDIKSLINIGEELGIKRLSALINRTSQHYLSFSEMLISQGFKPYASKVEVFRDLHDINGNSQKYKWISLEDSIFTEYDFKKYWEQCMAGSDNEPSSLTMEEHLNSLKNELGDNWRNSCKVIYLGNKPIGISIPHIEPGTLSEGRLFYFGILPEERGKGHSVLIHYQSLYILKKMGAKYYIGSTHEKNIKMQKVFLRNSCRIKAQTQSFYKYFDS
jgi:hypothetical protein